MLLFIPLLALWCWPTMDGVFAKGIDMLLMPGIEMVGIDIAGGDGGSIHGCVA